MYAGTIDFSSRRILCLTLSGHSAQLYPAWSAGACGANGHRTTLDRVVQMAHWHSNILPRVSYWNHLSHFKGQLHVPPFFLHLPPIHGSKWFMIKHEVREKIES